MMLAAKQQRRKRDLERGGINALALKIIAVISMLVDHVAASGLLRRFYPNGLLGLDPNTSYEAARAIGRLAFPIFCFLMVEGIKHTGNWKRYVLRVAVFALISEIPFDMALNGKLFNWGYQNVLWTLLLGMVPLLYLKLYEGRDKTAGYIALVIVGAMAAETFLLSDYGASGVVQIGIMGFMLPEKAEEHPVKNTVICAIAIAACCLVQMNYLEIPAAIALIPIFFYNGKKGPGGRFFQYFVYTFYPVHLLILGLLVMGVSHA